MTTFNSNVAKRFIIRQKENENRYHTMNWAGDLDTATISSSDWSTEGSITIANESNATYTATCQLSGTPGRYRVVNQITDSGGNVLERLLDVRIEDNSFDSVPDYE